MKESFDQQPAHNLVFHRLAAGRAERRQRHVERHPQAAGESAKARSQDPGVFGGAHGANAIAP